MGIIARVMMAFKGEGLGWHSVGLVPGLFYIVLVVPFLTSYHTFKQA